MKRRIRWRWIAAAGGAAVAIWVIVEVILAGIGTPPLPNDQMGITLRGGRVQGSRIVTKAWSFDYHDAQLSPDGTTGTVDGVHDGVVFRHGKPHLKITAQRISVDTMSLNFTAIGKVTVAMIGDPLNRSFDTDLVQWTNATKLLLMPTQAISIVRRIRSHLARLPLILARIRSTLARSGAARKSRPS